MRFPSLHLAYSGIATAKGETELLTREDSALSIHTASVGVTGPELESGGLRDLYWEEVVAGLHCTKRLLPVHGSYSCKKTPKGE